MLERKKIIVSMTSFPAAIPFAVRAVQSVLEGAVKPDKVILYLTASQFPDGKLPPKLQELTEKNSIFEVRFYDEDIRSYTKLIPALKDFPNDIIVTVDDDVFYHREMLRGLLRRHLRYPDAIIGHRVRRLKLNAPYLDWKCYRPHRYLTMRLRPSFGNVQTGCGGVLYPPSSLNAEMLDPALFMEIAPTVDDIWFWAAAVANGTKIAAVPFGCCNLSYINKPMDLSLNKVNNYSGTDVNRSTFERIVEKYPIIKKRISSTNIPSCAISRYGGGKNRYTQLMKDALAAMDIEPRPLHFAGRTDFVWLHWFEKGKKFSSKINFLETCRKKGVKVVWNVHNRIPHETTYDREHTKPLMKLLADISHKIVIHSNQSIQLMEELCGDEKNILEKVVLVPHPHYIGAYGPQIKDHRIDNKRLSICFFGAVKQYKNVELLISAVTELGFDDIELNIYGRCRPYKYAQSLRHLSKLSNNINTHFKFIHDRNIPKILAGCHLLVLPYNLDSSLNSGTTILAFSYGRTVLSPITGTLEDIEDKSLFFAYSYNSADQHKDELKKQLTAIRERYKGNYNELLKLGERCREYVSMNNSLEQVTKQLKQVFTRDEFGGGCE